MIKPITTLTVLLGVMMVGFTGCGNGDDPANDDPAKIFGLTQDERMDIFHAVENAVAANETLGREDVPEGGPECVEYINCLDDDSKLVIAKEHGLTLEQLEEIVHEGNGAGWTQW
jgi:hypothetical protein